MWFQGSSAKLFWCNSNKSAWERMQPKKDKEQQWEWWPPDSFGSRNNVIHCLAGEVRPRRSRQLGLSLTNSGWLNTLERLRDNLLMGRWNRDWNSNQPLSLSYHDLEFYWESRYLKLELPPLSYPIKTLVYPCQREGNFKGLFSFLVRAPPAKIGTCPISEMEPSLEDKCFTLGTKTLV